MKKNLVFGLIGLIPWNCTTDFKLTADYKEVMVVWCLLSQNDTTHYVRIQKAYLDENTSALVIAQNPDSIYYPDILNVTIEQDDPTNVWTLERIDGDTLPEPIKKETGVFSSTKNILYRFTAALDENATYKLTVENTVSGLTATGTTNLVKDFRITRPITGLDVNFVGPSGLLQVNWDVAVNGRLHDLTIRVRYWIADAQMHTVKLKDTFVDIPIFRGRSFTETGQHDITKEAFYNGVAAKLDPIPGFVRHSDSLDFIFAVGSIALADYVNYNQAQTGITSSQVIINYTNIEGGLGLFASRYSKTVVKVPLFSNSLDTLACGAITGHLNFVPTQSLFYPFCE